MGATTLSPEWRVIAAAFCPLNSGGSERERGDLRAQGGRGESLGLREEGWNSGSSGRERGILEAQGGRVEDPASLWPVTVLVAALVCPQLVLLLNV